jgi:glycosyltransferase involved in cell wall biosynthesis
MENVLISVVMTVFNAQDHIRDSIESIINQTYQNFEFIIVNDGSTDESRSIINSYKKTDNRIIFIDRSNNKGIPYSANEALSICKGKYIAKMDADDVSLPERLMVQLSFMENNKDISVCGAYMQAFGDLNFLFDHYELEHVNIIEQMKTRCPIGNSTSFIRREIIVKNNIKYDLKYKYAQDYKFWFDISKTGLLHNLNRVLVKYRITKSQISTKYHIQQSQYGNEIIKEVINHYGITSKQYLRPIIK